MAVGGTVPLSGPHGYFAVALMTEFSEIRRQLEQEPDIPEIQTPRSDFERIYGSTNEKYTGEIDDEVMADWVKSNFHPFFLK